MSYPAVRPMPGFSHAVAALGLASLLTSCGGASGGPQDVLTEYRRALATRRYEDAYDLMSAELRREVSYAAFRRALTENPREVRDTVNALAPGDGPAQIEARVRYGLGEELTFVLEDGAWVIDTPVLDFYSQRTPRDALRSFVRAMERRRLDAILRLVPNESRRSMTREHVQGLFEGERGEETQALLQNLRAHLDDPIETTGDRASMPYAERFTVLFVREEGLWKIEDPD